MQINYYLLSKRLSSQSPLYECTIFFLTWAQGEEALNVEQFYSKRVKAVPLLESKERFPVRTGSIQLLCDNTASSVLQGNTVNTFLMCFLRFIASSTYTTRNNSVIFQVHFLPPFISIFYFKSVICTLKLIILVHVSCPQIHCYSTLIRL